MLFLGFLFLYLALILLLDKSKLEISRFAERYFSFQEVGP